VRTSAAKKQQEELEAAKGSQDSEIQADQQQQQQQGKDDGVDGVQNSARGFGAPDDGMPLTRKRNAWGTAVDMLRGKNQHPEPQQSITSGKHIW
jgi:hypothetical protein